MISVTFGSIAKFLFILIILIHSQKFRRPEWLRMRLINGSGSARWRDRGSVIAAGSRIGISLTNLRRVELKLPRIRFAAFHSSNILYHKICVRNTVLVQCSFSG